MPFVIDLAEHRLRGPDRLSSLRYAFDLNYLKSIDSLNSSTRTADQTETAFSWFEGEQIWRGTGGLFSHSNIFSRRTRIRGN